MTRSLVSSVGDHQDPLGRIRGISLRLSPELEERDALRGDVRHLGRGSVGSARSRQGDTDPQEG